MNITEGKLISKKRPPLTMEPSIDDPLAVASMKDILLRVLISR